TAGRTVIVGGASARTGGAVLRAFLGAGYQVAATTRRPDALRATLAGLPGGDGGVVVEADLLEPAARDRGGAVAPERLGPGDALAVLASGGFQQTPFAETALGDLRRLVEGNLYLTYNLCRAVIPVMLAQWEAAQRSGAPDAPGAGGHILTVAGGSALDPGY